MKSFSTTDKLRQPGFCQKTSLDDDSKNLKQLREVWSVPALLQECFSFLIPTVALTGDR